MILVIGEILFDVFENYKRIGGAPFNFAFHLKKLGWPVRFLTCIGNDTNGKTIVNLLKKHGFNPDDAQIDDNHPTGTVQVTLNDQGVPKFDIHTDVAYDYFDTNAFKPIHWPDVQMIYIGTLAQRTNGNILKIQELMSKKHERTNVFFDINLRPPHVNTTAIEASLEQTDILKLNEGELSMIQNLYKGPNTEDQQISWIMEKFLIEMVVLTKGSRGSIIYTADKVVEAPIRKNISIADTVGAGDAFAAVVAVGYLNSLPPETIIEEASDFATYICTLQGAIPEDMNVYQPIRRQLGGATHA